METIMTYDIDTSMKWSAFVNAGALTWNNQNITIHHFIKQLSSFTTGEPIVFLNIAVPLPLMCSVHKPWNRFDSVV